MCARVLIIDDEPRWINFAEIILGKIFDVEVATNLEMALTKLRGAHHDLIIVSSRRLDILEAIRKESPGERMVVATGQPTTREAINVYRHGTLDYFAKDFKPEALSQRVFEAIQKPTGAPA